MFAADPLEEQPAAIAGGDRNGARAVPKPEIALREAIRAAGLALGFARVGFTAAEPDLEAGQALAAWRRAGHAGRLAYLLEPASRHDPRALLPAARTVIVAALPYPTARTDGGALAGSLARFAQGPDYHFVVRGALTDLAARAAALAGRPLRSRICVDTSPLLEHAFAARSGVGFTGRNTLTVVPRLGSYVVLGELLLDLELPPDPPLASRCGRCTRCLAACPTGALVEPYTLDARRCISYLTIELKGSIPREMRPLVGAWVFGCDRCQEVCPHNAVRSRQGSERGAWSARSPIEGKSLVDLLQLGAAAYRRLVQGTALRRLSRPHLARNAAVALGNRGELAAVPALSATLEGDSSSLVREHAAWALGQVVARAALSPGSERPQPGIPLVQQALAALERARIADPAAEVREEAARARAATRAGLP